ncbi:hypothetical protein [Anaerotignum propionicum]|nr:hypothetical protein [Anaerotignum propionicum]MCQ4936417.1 hypothetical protein [Anaerotignum propionicum]
MDRRHMIIDMCRFFSPDVISSCLCLEYHHGECLSDVPQVCRLLLHIVRS